MTEFIGSRISLISKRDIRYVGTLHEISSENSTVALENVTSYGTEGRRPEEEIPPNLENVYEYIVFRGSDVKDLRIEEAPKEGKKAEPPKIPDDPAILGSTRRPNPAGSEPSQPSSAPVPQSQVSPSLNSHRQIQQHEVQDRHAPQPHQYLPQQQFPYGMPPSGQRFGPGPFPPGHPAYSGHPGHNFQGPSYGGPPGWYPPYGIPPHMQGQFPPNQMSGGHPNQFGGPRGFPPGPPPQKGADPEQNQSFTKESSAQGVPARSAPVQAPTPPLETKPEAATIMPSTGDTKGNLAITKSNRLVPAIPLSPAIKTALTTNGITKQSAPANNNKQNATVSVEDANRDARAAVAAAMAKLPPPDKKVGENGNISVDNLAKGVNELRTSDSRGRGRGGRGGNRGNRGEARRVDVPKTDFDFESSNAKFNKHDLAKEATAVVSPTGTPNESASEITDIDGKRGSDAGFAIPVLASYNKSSSFFDDISSEIKDRADVKEGGYRLGGREFRHEERQKNVETFGQGSVDNFRFARGRGRGRGYGRGRGRGGYNQGGRGSSNPRGGRGGAATAVEG